MTSRRTEHLDFDAEGLGHRGAALNSSQRSSVSARADRADLAEAGGDAGLGLQPGVKLGRIFREPGQVLRGAQLADQPGRMPGRAGCELLALQQHDVGPAELGQVIGDGAAGHAAADDDDASFLWKCGFKHGASHPHAAVVGIVGCPLANRCGAMRAKYIHLKSGAGFRQRRPNIGQSQRTADAMTITARSHEADALLAVMDDREGQRIAYVHRPAAAPR